MKLLTALCNQSKMRLMILGFMLFIMNAFATESPGFTLNLPVGQPKGLVVMLHGCKTTAKEFDEGTEMSRFALSRGLAVFYPEQSVFANVDRCWNWFWNLETDWLTWEVSAIQKQYHLNRNQTVLMGMSAGGAQASILANCSRHLFSKVLIHSGLSYLAAQSLSEAEEALLKGSRLDPHEAARTGFYCNPSQEPIEFHVVHGDRDLRVIPLNADQTADEFLELNRLLFRSHGVNTHPRIIVKEVPGSSSRLGFQETDFYLNDQFIGKKVIIHLLAHEWSGGNPIQPRNNPRGPNIAYQLVESL